MQTVRSTSESSGLKHFEIPDLKRRLYWADPAWVVMEDKEGQPRLYSRWPLDHPPRITEEVLHILSRCEMEPFSSDWVIKEQTWTMFLRRISDD